MLLEKQKQKPKCHEKQERWEACSHIHENHLEHLLTTQIAGSAPRISLLVGPERGFSIPSSDHFPSDPDAAGQGGSPLRTTSLDQKRNKRFNNQMQTLVG